MEKVTLAKTPKAQTLEEVLQRLRGDMPALRHAYAVRSLGVFGTVARGEQQPRNDVDILVDFAHPPTFFQFIELEDRLTDLLGTRADLVMRTVLKPRIGDRILAEVVDV
jgi:predicted nucleotidyltransferase